jgi:predicted alpha/beta superfamily hydrolase
VVDNSPRHTASPQVQVLRENFWMPQLGRRRRVWIYLPADYAQQPARRYPVLYLHDGQNVFDEATSFAGEWGIDETLDELYASGRDATGCIVVAVDNGGEFRGDEYVPWRNKTVKTGGQGAAYADFLALTLKPFIDRSFRTQPDAAHTGIAGSSLGGLISVYAALRYPKVFGRVGAFSPAFWICNDKLLTYVKKHPPMPSTKFYFVGGLKESKWMLPQMTAWRDVLRASGVPNNNLSLQAHADGEHSEWFWRREFAAAYEWLFEPSKKE